MIGKGREVRIHTESEDWHLNEWLQSHPDIQVIDIRYIGEGFMIIYREGESNVS